MGTSTRGTKPRSATAGRRAARFVPPTSYRASTMNLDGSHQTIPIRRLLIAIVMVMVSTLPVFLAGASFLQLESDIGLTATTLGMVTAAFFLTAAVTSTPLGRLVERIGWRTAMRINCVVSTVVVVLIALLVNSPLVLGALLVVSGAVYGFTNPAANHALAQGAPPSKRGVVFGLKHAGIPASTLAAGAAVPLLVLTLGWRPTFALSTVFAVAAWLLIQAEPETSKTPTTDYKEQPTLPLNSRQLITLALGSACATWAAVFLGTFLVAGAVEAELTEPQAGLLLFAGSAASIAARVIAGLIADKRSSAGFVGVSLIMALGAVAFVLVSGAAGWIFALTVIVAFAFGWGWPGLMTYSVVNANAGSAASSSAVTQAGIFLGAGLGPVVLGRVVDSWSFRAAWLIVAVLLTVASVIVATVAFERRRTAATA